MTGIANPFAVQVAAASLTTSITTYTSGDQLGTEITFTSGVGASGYVTITSATLVDYSKVVGQVDMLIFGSSTTPASDNAANSWSDADMLKLVPGGFISFASPTVSANNYFTSIPNLSITAQADSSGNLYLDLITRSANAVFGAATDLKIRLGGFWWS